MKKFLIGLVIGLALGATGTYAIVKEKIQKVATMENAEKVVKASQEFGHSVQEILK